MTPPPPPDCWLHPDLEVRAYTLAARRGIAPGDEVTNDYATGTAVAGFRMPCHCGAALCRGVVTGEDWRRPELVDRYGPQ